MLVIKAALKPSEIEGLGLFAEENIPKGTTVWRYDPRFDIVFDPHEVEKMPDLQRELIDRYSYLSATSGKYIYSIDNSRFINHSASKNNLDVVQFPNEPETRGVANKDIKIGEEILINYRVIDAADAIGGDKYLSK